MKIKTVPKAALVVALMMGQVTPTTNPGNTITTLNWGASSAYADVIIIPPCIETNDNACGGTTGTNDTGGGGSGGVSGEHPTGDPDNGNDGGGTPPPPPPPPPKTTREICHGKVAYTLAVCNAAASADHLIDIDGCDGLSTNTGTVSTPVISGSRSTDEYAQCEKRSGIKNRNALDVCIVFEKLQMNACP
ncbi:MAG: hypothetical protein HRT35_32235 [Algicola sp.]|nr:hypothetical protein [Algicola sp.]